MRVLRLAAVAVLALAGAAAADEPPVNLALPTLGGRLVWSDELIHAGWRIQRNVYSGHHRLLDANDVRRAWGSYRQCEKAFAAFRRQRHLRPASTHMVLLIHGLGRSRHSFGDLAERLAAAGYDAEGINYPSFHQGVEASADQLERVLDRLVGTERISFVTHSLGSLVLRAALARPDAAWRARIALGGAVLVAPPSQGSAVAALLAELPPYHWLLGDAGAALTPAAVAAMPGLEIPFAVIAGGLGDGKGFNPLIAGDDDGTLAVAETRLAGSADFLLLPGRHSFIQARSDTASAVLSFLADGTLDPARTVP